MRLADRRRARSSMPVYRELLANLVRKELRVSYKNSVLGFGWSLVNPLMYLVIFSVVLVGFLRVALPAYHFYLLSGLLAWNLFATGVSHANGSIVDNATLVSKIYFPRVILPLSSIGAALVHFVLQLGVLFAAMLVLRYHVHWDAGMALLPLALAVQLLFMFGCALLMSAMNVFYRDVKHLLELSLLAWFWLTPIVYPSALAQGRFFGIYLLNPMTPVVLGFQRALYARTTVVQDGAEQLVLVDAPITWYAERLAYVGAGAIVLIVVAWLVFRRLERRFAEEL